MISLVQTKNAEVLYDVFTEREKDGSPLFGLFKKY